MFNWTAKRSWYSGFGPTYGRMRITNSKILCLLMLSGMSTSFVHMTIMVLTRSSLSRNDRHIGNILDPKDIHPFHHMKKSIHHVIQSHILRDELDLNRLHENVSNVSSGKWRSFFVNYARSRESSSKSYGLLRTILQGTNRRTVITFHVEKNSRDDILRRQVTSEVLVPNSMGTAVYDTISKFASRSNERKQRRRRLFQQIRSRL